MAGGAEAVGLFRLVRVENCIPETCSFHILGTSEEHMLMIELTTYLYQETPSGSIIVYIFGVEFY